MNFMVGRAGFCQEITAAGRGMPSSSSSCLPPAAAYQEPYGGGSSQFLDLSPTTNCSGGDEDSDDHMIVRRDGEGSSTRTAHADAIEREHMFDKVVTPSDVGKLNRLVIPKQHAEKYFPLDSSTNEKGLLLNFEDRNGKPWRFRYSYWNSSQSYVMTKGWSRFVKEKQLDPGDIVSFQRGVGKLGKDRLFIDWRRRPEVPELPLHLSIPNQFSHHPWNSPFLQPPAHLLQPNGAVSANHQRHRSQYHYYPTGYSPYSYNSVVNGNPCRPASIMYLRSSPGAGVYGPQQTQTTMGRMHAQLQGGSGEDMVYESVPVVQGKAAAKRLRLFGVNMDCPISDSDECDILSSTSLPQYASTMHLLPHLWDDSTPSINPTNHKLKGKGSTSLDLDI